MRLLLWLLLPSASVSFFSPTRPTTCPSPNRGSLTVKEAGYSSCVDGYNPSCWTVPPAVKQAAPERGGSGLLETKAGSFIGALVMGTIVPCLLAPVASAGDSAPPREDTFVEAMRELSSELGDIGLSTDREVTQSTPSEGSRRQSKESPQQGDQGEETRAIPSALEEMLQSKRRKNFDPLTHGL